MARRAFAWLIASHAIIDMFPMYITSLMLVWTRNLELTEAQTSFIYMATPIFSGACQPFFAWLGDRYDSRLTGPAGMTLGALCIGSLGFAQTFWQFIALQILGVIGTGMYHPVSTALAGQTGSRALRPGKPGGRALAIGIFISAGMLGHTVGPIVATRLNHAFGTPIPIAWTIIPALLVAFALLITTRRIPHRHDNHADLHASIDPVEARRRWLAVINLAAQNALRFISNVAMFILFNTWAGMHFRLLAAKEGSGVSQAEVADLGAEVSANLAACMTIGMGVSVVLTGRLIAPGRERLPLVALSMIGAVFMGAIGFVGDAFAPFGLTNHLTMLPVYLCAALAPVGFFSTFPIATSLAQRLMPARTGLVTSMMMGMGWMFSALSTPLSILFFGGVALNKAQHLPAWRIDIAFLGFATLLVAAGLLALALPRDLLAKAADEH